ncbi:hypothetical protein GCM10028805_61520 [Spirosoma harenae]
MEGRFFYGLSFLLICAFPFLVMSAVSRGVVYSLIAVVLVLLLGVMALLGVSYNRHQRLEDATIDLKRSLNQQESKITELEERLQDCDTAKAVTVPDSSWNASAPAASGKDVSQAPSLKW